MYANENEQREGNQQALGKETGPYLKSIFGALPMAFTYLIIHLSLCIATCLPAL
jgi:hypothetical protein